MVKEDFDWLVLCEDVEIDPMDDLDQDLRILERIDKFRVCFEGKAAVAHIDWLVRTLRAALKELRNWRDENDPRND